MALVTRDLLRRYAAQIPPLEKTARALKASIIREHKGQLTSLKPFDLFLSPSPPNSSSRITMTPMSSSSR